MNYSHLALPEEGADDDKDTDVEEEEGHRDVILQINILLIINCLQNKTRPNIN